MHTLKSVLVDLVLLLSKWATAAFDIRIADFFFLKYALEIKDYDPGEAQCIPLPTLIKILFLAQLAWLNG